MPTACPEPVEGSVCVGMSDSLGHQKHACRGQAWHRVHFLPTFMNYTPHICPDDLHCVAAQHPQSLITTVGKKT